MAEPKPTPVTIVADDDVSGISYPIDKEKLKAFMDKTPEMLEHIQSDPFKTPEGMSHQARIESERAIRNQHLEEFRKTNEELNQKAEEMRKQKPVYAPHPAVFAGMSLLFLAMAGGKVAKLGAAGAMNGLSAALQGLHEGNHERFNREWKVYEQNYGEMIEGQKRVVKGMEDILRQDYANEQDRRIDFELYLKEQGIMKAGEKLAIGAMHQIYASQKALTTKSKSANQTEIMQEAWESDMKNRARRIWMDYKGKVNPVTSKVYTFDDVLSDVKLLPGNDFATWKKGDKKGKGAGALRAPSAIKDLDEKTAKEIDKLVNGDKTKALAEAKKRGYTHYKGAKLP